jgi:hypothetical protein
LQETPFNAVPLADENRRAFWKFSINPCDLILPIYGNVLDRHTTLAREKMKAELQES